MEANFVRDAGGAAGWRRPLAALLVSTALAAPVLAQQRPRPPAAEPARPSAEAEARAAESRNQSALPATAANAGVVRSVVVRGTERLEPETVRSYLNLAIGDRYDRDALDTALKALYASELFSDATIRDDNGALIVEVKENPVINRIIIEGAKRVKEEKIREEIRLAPRQIFTRSKTRADLGRILELYRRGGRFAASVEPKIVQLEQNRVDVIFEISEGPKSKIRQINILGNTKFKEGAIRKQMASKQSRTWRFFTSNDTYDPDRLAYDQQKLRQYYLTEGYADFRVASVVAELTPDKKDFIVTYVVEEGERYKFGKIELESQLRDIKPKEFRPIIRMKEGDWYNAQAIENTVESLSETAGLLGYAFADVRPQFERNKEDLKMNVTFQIGEVPRVYVERVSINGNTITHDNVIRREFRLAEGDAFNSIKVKRSKDRLLGLGFFQDKLDIEQKPGTTPDRIALEANIQERPTGELQLSAGSRRSNASSSRPACASATSAAAARNCACRAISPASRAPSKPGSPSPIWVAATWRWGVDVFRRDFRSFRFTGNNTRDTTYTQVSTGFQVRTGFSITEFWAASLRYGLSREEIGLDEAIFFSNGVCDPLRAGRFLCEQLGNRTVSTLGYSIIYNSLNNVRLPSAGQRFYLQPGCRRYSHRHQVRHTRANYDYFTPFVRHRFRAEPGCGRRLCLWLWWAGRDPDQPLLPGPAAVPRFQHPRHRPARVAPSARSGWFGGAGSPSGAGRFAGRPCLLSGARRNPHSAGFGRQRTGHSPVDLCRCWRAVESEIAHAHLPGWADGRRAARCPARLRPACPTMASRQALSRNSREYAETARFGKPRVSVGIGVNWNSPFGPFRFDLAKALVKQPGDDPQLFQFNVGTAF